MKRMWMVVVSLLCLWLLSGFQGTGRLPQPGGTIPGSTLPGTLPPQEQPQEPTEEPTESAANTEPPPVLLSRAAMQMLQPNEIGWALVMEYHLIQPGEDNEYSRTPDSLRADLEWLYEHDFYPIRFRDLSSGTINIPPGKSPVALTFDDSSPGQFRYLADGTIDPESAMGILLAFAETHRDFPAVATFFPLLDLELEERILWGQPELADQKLHTIIDLGGEIGSHTVSHEPLDLVGAERIQWQLAFSTFWLEERIGNDYDVISLALPLGAYPADESLLHSGESEGVSYAFTGAAEVAGGPTPSPYATVFDPYHIMRAQAIPVYIENVLALYEARPDLKYISDGDPTTITIPTEETLDPQLQGIFDEAEWSDQYSIVRYDRP